MNPELLGFVGLGLIATSLIVLTMLVICAPLRPDLAAIDDDLDELASGREPGEDPIEPPAYRDWMAEPIERPWDDPSEDAHHRRLFG